MSSPYTIVAGSTTPVLTGTLAYADGTVPNLVGATVNLVLQNQDATATYLNAACTVAGEVATYSWTGTDNLIPGTYAGQFAVTFANSTVQYFPTAGYFTVVIVPALTGVVKARPGYVDTQDLIWQTRAYLEGKSRPGRNVLAAALDTVTNQVQFTYTLGGAASGVPISIGLENMYIYSAAGLVNTVQRGIDGSTPAIHAAGDTILIDPEFTDFAIFNALNQELLALPGEGLYQVKSLDRTMLTTTDGYDLASDVEDVLDVRWQDLTDTSQWTTVEMFEVAQDMPTSAFPSGVALFLPDRPYNFPLYSTTGITPLGNALRIRYRAAFGQLTGLSDDVLGTTGMPSSAVDILPIGAAVRLMAGRPIQRVFNLAQSDPRNAAEVKAGDVLNAAAALRQLRAQRVQAEADNLSRQWVSRAPARTLMGNQRVMRRTGWR